MSYVFNPRLKFKIEVEAMSKQHGRRDHTFESSGVTAGHFNLALQAAMSAGDPVDATQLEPQLLEQLLQIGLVVEESDITPDVFFLNRLSELSGARSPSALVVNPKVWLDGGGALPAPVARRIGSRPSVVSSQWPIVWVQDAVTEFIHPIHLEPAEVPIVSALLASRTVSALEPQMAARLTVAGVLLERRATNESRKHFQAHIEECRKSVRQSQYAVIRQVLPQVYLKAAARFLRAFDEAGYLDKRGDVIRYRHVYYQDPLNQFVHRQLAAIVAEVAPEPIKPSYCYLASYRFGSRLYKHTDREQCEWNVSLQLDNSPTIAMAKAWPIFLEIRGKPRKVTLDVGDAVIYSGTRIPHWRPPLPKGRTTTLCFFHFVKKSFKGSLR